MKPQPFTHQEMMGLLPDPLVLHSVAGVQLFIQSIVDKRDAQWRPLVEDTERLKFIAEAERATTNSKWLAQVVADKGVTHTAYFAAPPTGTPAVIHESKLEALRAAIDSARGESK